MDFKKKYRRVLLMLSGIGFFAMMVLGYVELRNSIPDEVRITEGKDELKEVFANPLVTWEDSIPVSGSRYFTIPCELLDVVFLKNVKVEVVEPVTVQVSGSAVGIYMKTDGIMIVDTQEIEGEDGLYYEPADHLVQPGDYITAFNNEPLSSKKDLIEDMKCCDGKQVLLTLLRDGNTVQLAIEPVKTAGDEYKLGIWVRDDTQGIGTLTFMEADGTYGALGHGISDVDTGNLIQIQGGDLYATEIIGIKKGEKGAPGELSGLICYEGDRIIGSIDANTEHGIFGTVHVDGNLEFRELEVAFKQDIQVGAATILCALDGKVEEYQVNIEDIQMSSTEENKSFVIQITDERLLEATGGIVQGMSGAPVIQDGKLVGAVTHVFVSDPTRGYGIFIEEMLEL